MALPGITNVGRSSAGDGFDAFVAGADDPTSDNVVHFLDTQENRNLLRRLEEWWCEARDLHADNRREQMIDADYYDCLQWTAADAAVLQDRGQAPLTFPLIKQMCDWVIGTERRTRIDWDVLPRKESDVQAANVKKQVLKYISDINGAGWERSAQFGDQIKVGVGWTEECYNNDQFEEPITVRWQDWKGMWWDPYSRHTTLRDCRYLHRAKWLDLDYAVAMFPDRSAELQTRATDALDPLIETLELEASLPQMFYSSGYATRGMSSAGVGSLGLFGTTSIERRSRKRVLCLETWYRKAVNTPMLLGDDVDGKVPFDPNSADHQQMLARGAVSLVDSVSEQMMLAIWTPGLLLRSSASPYKHRRFPFTPAWGYRRHRDGMPYGLIRPSRDSQDEFNKRKSRILFELSTTKVMFENGAFDQGDEDDMLEEIKRADGEVRVAKGALEHNKIRIERGLDKLEGQIRMLEEARESVYESSGVTRENTGTSTGDQSGRAILAKQQQGSVTTAELFDNFRQAIQESGQKTLSNCEQFMTMPKIIRVAGPDGAKNWVPINQPYFDPVRGGVFFENDITDSEADFIVDETDYRETVRMAMAESLFELIGRLPPQMAMALLDIAVDMTDLPNKQDLVNRIRKLNGQMAPGAENTPEGQAAAANQQQQQDAAAQRQAAKEQADIDLTHAKTEATLAKGDLDTVTAQHRAVQGKTDAMRTASLVRAAPNLAPAADRLWDPSQAFPMPPNQFVSH